MAEQRLIFEQSIEGMYLKGHPELLSPHVKAALKAVGIDLDAKLKGSYPADLVNEATRTFRKVAYAMERDDAKAYARIGERTVDGYFGTTFGKALVGVLKLFGVKRIVGRLPEAMRSGSNFQNVTLEWKGETEAHLTLAFTEPDPHINVGVLKRGFTHWFSVPSFQISVLKVHPPGATYRLTWTA
jgi:uncharacterized protein (TIGR02265 family)